MKRLLLTIAVVALWCGTSGAQEIIKSGKIENRRDSTLFHVRWSTVGDTSETFTTDGWAEATIQYSMAAADSAQHYNIVPYWSNDQSSWVNFGDSIQVVDSLTHFDQIIMRPLVYMRLEFRVGGETVKTGQLATGTVSICAKGSKGGLW